MGHYPKNLASFMETQMTVGDLRAVLKPLRDGLKVQFADPEYYDDEDSPQNPVEISYSEEYTCGDGEVLPEHITVWVWHPC